MELNDFTCPVCKGHEVEKAAPITKKVKGGRVQIVAYRYKCLDCGYTDRTVNFKGALSVSGIRTLDMDFRTEDLDA